MRKQQIALIERAKKYDDVSDDQLVVLSDEKLSIQTLKIISAYFRAQNKNELDKSMTANEAKYWAYFVDKQVSTQQYQRVLLTKLLPYEVGEPDSLIGNPIKRRIFTAFKMYLRVLENEKLQYGEQISNNAFYGYKLYCTLLYSGMESKLIKLLFKQFKKELSTPLDMLFIFRNYPIIYDDYIHNVENSLLWQLIQRDIVGEFNINENTLKAIYNNSEHKFIIDVTNFDKYFRRSNYFDGGLSLNRIAMADDYVNEFPLIHHLKDFCETNEMCYGSFSDPYQVDEIDSPYREWFVYKLYNQEMQDKIEQCYDILDKPFQINEPAWSLRVKIGTNYFIQVQYQEYDSILVNSSGWWTEKNRNIVELLIAPDGKLYVKYGLKNKKTIPLPLKTLMFLLSKNTLVSSLLRYIIAYHAKTNPFFNDVIADCENNRVAIPLSYNDIFAYHNRSHLFKNKYKTSQNIQINWNKQNINLSYLIIKSLPYVDEAGKQILIQQKDTSLLPDKNYDYKLKEKIIVFLSRIIKNNILSNAKKEMEIQRTTLEKEYMKQLDEMMGHSVFGNERNEWIEARVQEHMIDQFRLNHLVNDYVNMCLRTKSKIRLDIKTPRQIEKVHDDLANNQRYYESKTNAVKVPKNSKFNKLRDMLPDDFEWIKNKKRLVIETELQHHCVWSYADKITEDRCAIYSYVDKTGQFADDGKPKRYTIEFTMTPKGKYKINQVQGKYDREHTKQMTLYIQELLDIAQKETQQK